MSIDEQALRAIAFLALRIRKSTAGAGPWDEVGLMSNLRKLQNRNLHMTIEHVIRHAADPKAKNPGVLQGSFTPDAPTTTGRPYPPKRHEQCRIHAGQWADNCGGCRTDALADDRGHEPQTWTPGDHATPAAAIRERLREAGK